MAYMSQEGYDNLVAELKRQGGTGSFGRQDQPHQAHHCRG